MPDLPIDLDLLRRFEKQLNPALPERSEIPTKVVGFGEISTVLEIGPEADSNLVYKRMPMFRTEQEALRYEALHTEYVQVLKDRVGLRVVPSRIARVVDEAKGRVVVYIAQQKLPSQTLGHKAIHHLSATDIKKLVQAVLRETSKVFSHNKEHKGRLEVGLDGQISNWAILNCDPEAPRIGDEVQLVYCDTGTPMLRKDGKEQLDPELFLRSAPRYLVWLIRLLFLKHVMTRYYDIRYVTIDMVANFFKEQQPDLIPDLVDRINESLSPATQKANLKPVTVDEIRSYYRNDARIWRSYLTVRKVDRFMHKIVGKNYPYILPGKIKR